MKKGDYQKRYEKWWLGKEVRFHEGSSWRKVAKITLIGPPSFVYGVVELEFYDGNRAMVPIGRDAFRPRKWDVEVKKTSPL